MLDVHSEPSNTVKNLPNFSPDALHCYSFWIGTSGGVLDLLAYNEDAYKVWLIELERVAKRNGSMSRSAVQAFKGSSVHSRPASSHGGSARHTPRSAVSPEAMGGLGGSTDGSGVTIDTSVFVRGGGSNLDTIPVGHDLSVPSSDRSLFSKGRQVVPIASSSGSCPPSARKSGLSFIGESYRPDGSGDHVHLQSDPVTSSDDIV